MTWKSISKLSCTYISLILLITLGAPQAFHAQKNSFSTQWDNGFKLESEDKAFSLKFGGRLMVDHAIFFQDKELDNSFGHLITQNGVEIRRARLYFSGTVYNNVSYKLQLDFANGKAAMKDAYIEIKGLPIANKIRVGNFKEPFRFDALTSSKYTPFLERALFIDFSQVRNNGIMISNDLLDKKISIQAGLFRLANGFANDKEANNGFAFTSRISTLLLNNKDNKQLMHLGIGYSLRNPDDKTYNISSRPEAHLSGIKYISTGSIPDVRHVNLLNLEAVLVSGPFSFQGEYLIASIETLHQSLQFSSYYGQLSYFLTGESKKYKSSYSGFNRIIPNNNFGNKNGSGALEFAIRYSQSDLSNKIITGGEQSDITIGLNWYLNPVTKVMLNSILVGVKGKGNATIFQARFQIDF